MAPGQRARRLLENRAPEWHDGKIGPVLDATDLSAVEAGAAGMRAWTTDEARLVEASRQAEERRVAEEEERQRQLREAQEREEQERLAKEHAQEQQKRNRRVARGADCDDCLRRGGLLAVE